ncbi:Protein cereblon [Toxocara canis]|uniref:Protein cereblon n=1 Tax=Toxocara canis TaxID=6265 RepID=A0A0B2V6P2_TOXCA|nr:Protein cereblon [Toxocara canis]
MVEAQENLQTTAARLAAKIELQEHIIERLLVTVASHDALLCRHCGHTVTHSSMLLNEKSPLALRSYNMSVLGKDQVVQLFQNPVPQTFNVITALTADLQLSGKAYMHATWFPEHEWTICVCSRCGTHLGWYFQSGNIQKKSTKSFVGLILDSLISDDYVDTLTRVP